MFKFFDKVADEGQQTKSEGWIIKQKNIDVQHRKKLDFAFLDLKNFKTSQQTNQHV